MPRTDFFYRTVPFKTFQSQVGYAVANFNTVIVGLAAVKVGTAKKPDDLAVGWSGANPTFLATEARHFATKALLVYAVDGLDKYLENIGINPSPISDRSLRDTLVGVPQITSPAATFLPPAAMAELKRAINSGTTDEIISGVGNFNSEFGEKRRPAHIRVRLDALSKLFQGNPSHYLAAVRLLVSWRNRHVHQSDEIISQSDRTDLLQNSTIFLKDHSNTDIALSLQHYDDKTRGPTLKDISTLVSVLQRVIGTIDEAVIRSCNLTEYAKQALQKVFKKMEHPQQRLKSLWWLDQDARQRKLTVYLRDFGFQDEVPNSKKVGRQFPQGFFDQLVALDRTEAATYFRLKAEP
jgi:hypothetical protein